MKFVNGIEHICSDCGTEPCEYHDCQNIIDGWEAEWLNKDTNKNGGYYKIKKCPHFTDGSDCKSCANFTKCKMIIPYGKECVWFARRAKKSDRVKLIDELKELSLLMTSDECESVHDFIIGLKMGDSKLEYSEVDRESRERVKRLKNVRKFTKGGKK